MVPMLKKPSAWVPIAMSLTVLATMLIYIGISGPPVRQTDEGTGAHLFQIWLVMEVFMIGFFAIKWLPRDPKRAMQVLVFQIAGVIVACAPVFLLHL